MTTLPTAVQDQLDSGHFSSRFVIRFDLPNLVRGYTNGPRPFTYNGLTYIPNRWLAPLKARSGTSFPVPDETVVFSNVPTDNADDAIAAIAALDYLNAPVTITRLIADPLTGAIKGVASNAIYVLSDVEPEKGPANDKGERDVTLTLTLSVPGRPMRESTGVNSSQAEQQFDHDATDTAYEYAATNAEWVIPHGRQ